LVAVFFIYGLAFFIAGTSILIYPKKDSSYGLARNIWLVGCFGLTHGANEWMDMFLLMQPEGMIALKIIRTLVMPMSFLFLVQFGVLGISEKQRTPPAIKALPMVLFVIWASVVLASGERFLIADIMGRYLLGAPGTFLAAYALLIYGSEPGRQWAQDDLTHPRLAAGTFAVYGVLCGIIVPGADFFPASVLNYGLFSDIVGIPVQVFRTVCAVLLMYALVSTLKMFGDEKLRTIREAHDNLEKRVAERTLDLVSANEELEREIAERIQAVTELSGSEVRFRGAFENAAVGASMVDLEGPFIKVNRSLCEMLGYEEDEMLSMTFSDVTHPDDVQMSLDRMKDMLEGKGDHAAFENRYLHSDGHEIYVLISPSLVRDEDGEPQYFVALWQNITDRREAENRIRVSLREKEVLLQEVHHRVKNNMQVIVSLLKLQSRYVKEKETLDMFGESQSRINSMALIHEKLYMSDDLSSIDLSDYIKTLASSLLVNLGSGTRKVGLNTDLNRLYINTDTAIPCGLILNELVSNCLKHAFPGDAEGEISISLNKTDNDYYVLSVSDNGVGFPAGLDLRNSNSLGLELVTLLAETQLHGKIELNANGGTEFVIRFRELRYEKRI
jgi:PAS domain S-box-containing protein